MKIPAIFNLDRGTRRGQERTEEHSESSAISVHDLTVSYERKPVLWDVDLEIPAGKLVGVIGPNGAGKSTLLKACLGLIPAVSGRVQFYGRPWADLRHEIAYIPQRETVDWDFPVTALEVVTMGRYGHLGWLRPVNRLQKKLAIEAMEKLAIADLANRQISRLSGGQQQRVFLARALAQNAAIYLMDEPFAAVDAATERAIIALLRNLREEGRTCLIVHHDLASAPQYFDWTILINLRVVAYGPTGEILTEENLRRTYGGKLTLLSEAANVARTSIN